MKNIVISISLVLFTAIAAPKANAMNVSQSLCEYVNVDNKNKMRSFLKENRLKIRAVFDSVQCNGKNLLQFAAEKNATETGSLIVAKLSKKVVAEYLSTLAASELATIAEQRVNS